MYIATPNGQYVKEELVVSFYEDILYLDKGSKYLDKEKVYVAKAKMRYGSDITLGYYKTRDKMHIALHNLCNSFICSSISLCIMEFDPDNNYLRTLAEGQKSSFETFEEF